MSPEAALQKNRNQQHSSGGDSDNPGAAALELGNHVVSAAAPVIVILDSGPQFCRLSAVKLGIIHIHAFVVKFPFHQVIAVLRMRQAAAVHFPPHSIHDE